ncbi:MAG: glycosyltransferase family 87 protein [Candidatus Thermochlorobacter sp.]
MQNLMTLPASLRVKLYWSALASLALVIALSATLKQLHSSTRLKGDVHLIVNVGQHLLAGTDVYRHPLPDEPYPYLPGIALLLAPLGTFPPDVFVPLFVVLNLIFAVLSFLLLCKFFVGKSFFALNPSLQIALSFFTLLLALRFLLYEISSGQINLLVMLLTLYGLCLHQQKKEILGGFWIGLAMAIKLLTLPLGLWFVVKRDFKTLGGLMLGALIWLLFPSLFLGISHNFELLHSWLLTAVLKHAPVSSTIPFHDLLANHTDNISLQALILRLTTDVVAFTHEGESCRATRIILAPALVRAQKATANLFVL